MPCASRPAFFTPAYEHLLYSFLGTVLYAIPAALLPRSPLAAERAVKTCIQRGMYCENYPGFRGFYVCVCVSLALLVALSAAAHLAAVLSRGQPSRAGWFSVAKLATGAAVPLALDAGLSVLPLFLGYGPDYQRDLALTVAANSRYVYVAVAGACLVMLIAYIFIQAKAPEKVELVGSRRKLTRKTQRQRAAAAGVSCLIAYIIVVAMYWADLPSECIRDEGNCKPVMGFIAGLGVALGVFSMFYYAVLGTPSLIRKDDSRCWADSGSFGDSASSSVPGPSIKAGPEDGFGDPTRLEGEYWQPGGGFGRSGRDYLGPAYRQGDPRGTGKKMSAADAVFYQE